MSLFGNRTSHDTHALGARLEDVHFMEGWSTNSIVFVAKYICFSMQPTPFSRMFFGFLCKGAHAKANERPRLAHSDLTSQLLINFAYCLALFVNKLSLRQSQWGLIPCQSSRIAPGYTFRIRTLPILRTDVPRSVTIVSIGFAHSFPIYVPDRGRRAGDVRRSKFKFRPH